MEEKKDTFNVFLEDGRRAEKIVQLNYDPSSEEEKIITEFWEEPKIEKKLSKRVIDYKKPLVYKREIELTDENGEVIEHKVESLESESKLELRKHIKADDSVQSLSTQSNEAYVTREELQGVVSEGLMMLARTLKENNLKDPNAGKVSSYQAIMDEKYNPALPKNEENLDAKNYGLWAVLGVISAVFVYVTFIM